MEKNPLKEVYHVEKRIEQMFTGDHVELDRVGYLMMAPCHDKINFIHLPSGTKISEIKTTNDDDIRMKLDDGHPDESIVTFAFDIHPDSNQDQLVIAYSSGLLKYWLVKIVYCEEEYDTIKSVDHTLQRSWKSLHIGPIARVLFDTTKTLVATGGSDGSVKIWNLFDNYCTHNFKDKIQGVVNTVTFAPKFTQETYHLFCSGDDYVIHVWNLIDSKYVTTLTGHESKITQILFTNDASRFISGSRDKLVIIWNHKNFTKERTMAVYESVESMVLIEMYRFDHRRLHFDEKCKLQAKDEVLVVAGESGLFKVWDYETGNQLYAQERSLLSVDPNGVDDNEDKKSQYTQIKQLLYHPDQYRLLVISFDNVIVFHLVEDLTTCCQWVGSNDEILDVKFLGEQEAHIAVATNSPKIKVFYTLSLDCILLTGHTDIVLALATFRHDQFLLASSSKDNTVRVWRFKDTNFNQANCVFIGTGHTHSVTSLTTSMNESFFISGSEDTTLKYWKLQSDKNEEIRETPKILKAKFTQCCHEKTINSVDVAPNNLLVATGSQDRTAKLWELPSFKLIGVFREHRKGIWSVKFSPVDQILATGSADSMIKLWSIKSLQCLKTFQGHMASVLKIEFLDEGMQLLSTSSDGNMKIWSLRSTEATATFDAHNGKVWALCRSQDEEVLVTGADDSVITIWRNRTVDVKNLEALKKEESIQNEQALQNLLQEKSWLKALKMAIRFNYPLRCLTILKEIILENDGQIDSVVDQLSRKFRRDQILSLFEYSVHWNTNSKNWVVAHCILRTVFEQIPPGELLKMPGFKTKVERMLPYTERHLSRISRLRQYVTFADFVFEEMKLPVNETKN